LGSTTDGKIRNPKSEINGRNLEFDFEAGRNPVSDFFTQNPVLLREPTRRERLEAETELFGYAVSGQIRRPIPPNAPPQQP
jgi:hypothetical protein